jgi:hypothetical protein
MPRALRYVPFSSKPVKWCSAHLPCAALSQELVNFPRPELPSHLQEALLRASQESETIPEPLPNPSLPEHMKPRPNQFKSKQGRQKMPLHRFVCPFHVYCRRRTDGTSTCTGTTRIRIKRSSGRPKFTTTTNALLASSRTSSDATIPLSRPLRRAFSSLSATANPDTSTAPSRLSSTVSTCPASVRPLSFSPTHPY